MTVICPTCLHPLPPRRPPALAAPPVLSDVDKLTLELLATRPETTVRIFACDLFGTMRPTGAEAEMARRRLQRVVAIGRATRTEPASRELPAIYRPQLNPQTVDA